MLRKLIRYQKFWEKNGAKYCHQVEGIKIAILPPENYKHVRCVSTPTGNRERRWGFKTDLDLWQFVIYYKWLKDDAKESH
jgi:hypothetical protein